MPGLRLNHMFVFVVQIHEEIDTKTSNHGHSPANSLNPFTGHNANYSCSYTKGKVWQINLGMDRTVLCKSISSFLFKPKEENVYVVCRVKFLKYVLLSSVFLSLRNHTDYREEPAHRGELLALSQALASKPT